MKQAVKDWVLSAQTPPPDEFIEFTDRVADNNKRMKKECP